MRRRILLLVVGMTVLVVLAFAIPLIILIHNSAVDDGQNGLRNEARNIANYLRYRGTPRTTAEIKAALAAYDADRSASVELPDGTVLGRLPPGSLDDLPNPVSFPGGVGGLPGGPDGPGGDTQLQSWRDGDLAQIRVPTFGVGGFGQSTADVYTVRVWASDATVRSGQTAALAALAGASVGLILLGVALGELLTRRIVRPLVTTADTATRLATGDTTARAPTDGPVEVADVGRALNRLADRIDELIAEERETVADMSHRLRTPLTALRLEAEALDHPAEAERIGGHVTALERMLTAVIHAARRPQREGRIPASNATEVVGQRVAFWSALTEDQGRIATVDLPAQPLPVRAGAEDLAAAVDALLENVVAHTPEGTAFAVTLAPTERGARLVVADDGPGLPADEPVRGRSDRGSSGLGLDIARRSAVASGGSMTLGTAPSGGALITLEFGRP